MPPVAVLAVSVDLAVADDGVEITATVRTTDRTGVEMEALTAVSVAALTVVDMVKAVDKARDDHRRARCRQVRRPLGGLAGAMTGPPRAVVIVVSSRAAAERTRTAPARLSHSGSATGGMPYRSRGRAGRPDGR